MDDKTTKLLREIIETPLHKWCAFEFGLNHMRCLRCGEKRLFEWKTKEGKAMVPMLMSDMENLDCMPELAFNCKMFAWRHAGCSPKDKLQRKLEETKDETAVM